MGMYSSIPLLSLQRKIALGTLGVVPAVVVAACVLSTHQTLSLIAQMILSKSPVSYELVYIPTDIQHLIMFATE